jgi:hypothetical protein
MMLSLAGENTLPPFTPFRVDLHQLEIAGPMKPLR